MSKKKIVNEIKEISYDIYIKETDKYYNKAFKDFMIIVVANNCWHPPYNITACEIIGICGKENGHNF